MPWNVTWQLYMTISPTCRHHHHAVIIISRNLTLKNSQTKERRCLNLDIPPPSSSRFLSADNRGGPPGVAIRPPLHDSGVLIAMQRAPRYTTVRPLQQNKTWQIIAHFRCFKRNILLFREKKDARVIFTNLRPKDFYFRILQGFEGICPLYSEFLTLASVVIGEAAKLLSQWYRTSIHPKIESQR